MIHNFRVKRVNVHEAKTHLSSHLDLLERGEQDVIVVCRYNKPVAEIRALPAPRTTPRPIGLARGKVRVPKSFFEPLPEDVLDAFYGKR